MSTSAPSFPNDLSALFSSGNFALTGPAMDQRDVALQQARQNVGLSQQLFNQNEQLFPVELDSKRALAENYRGQAAHSHALAKKTLDDIAALPPMEQRQAHALLEMRGKQSDIERKMGDDKIAALGRAVSIGMNNGGTIPLDALTGLDPAMQKILSQKGGVQAAKKMVDMHNTLFPAYRQAMDTAQEHTRGQLGAASIHASTQRAIAESKASKQIDSTDKAIRALAAKGEPMAFQLLAMNAPDEDTRQQYLQMMVKAVAQREKDILDKQTAVREAGAKKPDIAALVSPAPGTPKPKGPIPSNNPTVTAPPPGADPAFEAFLRGQANGR